MGLPSLQALTVDHLRELAVREAMFANLDGLAAHSENDNLTGQQTADFSCASETIALRQTRRRGIHKPRQFGAALFINTAFTRFGKEHAGMQAEPQAVDEFGTSWSIGSSRVGTYRQRDPGRLRSKFDE